jgi:hypothetical protein
LIVREYSKQGCFGTFWGRWLVPGGLDVSALDRNQSLLFFPFHFGCLRIHSPSTAHKGGDPRYELFVHTFHLHLASVHTTCAYSFLKQFNLLSICSPSFHAMWPARSIMFPALFFIAKLLLAFAPFSACMKQLFFLSHDVLALQVTRGSHEIRRTAAQAGGRAPG